MLSLTHCGRSADNIIILPSDLRICGNTLGVLATSSAESITLKKMAHPKESIVDDPYVGSQRETTKQKHHFFCPDIMRKMTFVSSHLPAGLSATRRMPPVRCVSAIFSACSTHNSQKPTAKRPWSSKEFVFEEEAASACKKKRDTWAISIVKKYSMG